VCRRGDASAAVREGLANTGRVITAAAAVMVAVFISFALIRSILLPGVLEILGRRTWAFPSWVDRRLPQLAIEPPARPATAPGTAGGA
jgi:RND superfamily putative drug exporter